MKKIIVLFCIVVLSSLHTAAQETSYLYKIGLVEVDDAVTAKEATDHLRDIFHVFTAYNDSTNHFEFRAGINISKTNFEEQMNSVFYTVFFFEKKPAASLKKE